MAVLSALKRLAKLSGWLGLSVGAMVAASCGAFLASACGNTPIKTKDAQADATSKPDAAAEVARIIIPGKDAGADTVASEAAGQDAEPEPDANQSDLWNTPCE
jgi:hypothetical protein